MNVQDGVTDDYFDAVPVADGVAVRMSDNIAGIFADLLHRLLLFLDDDQAGGRSRSRDKVLRDMFPDAYRDRAQAQAFRERHATALRDTAAVRRVHDRCVSGTNHVIDTAEVDEWVVALGLGRFLHTRRNARKLTELDTWISYAQAVLVAAVNPKLLDL